MSDRIIKFRVWNKKYQQFTSPMFSELDIDQIFDNDDNYVFQQFTGLMDKNNKEIYEGDIVSCYAWFDGMENRPIKKSIIEVKLYYTTTITQEMCGGYDGTQRYEDVEIIGNIFENLNLLNEKV